MERVKLEQLVLDTSVYPRNEISSQTTRLLMDTLLSGQELPPIIVERKSMRVVDGFHRIHAHKKMGLEDIAVEFRVYKTDGELFSDAIRFNRTHGRPFDTYDLRRAITKLSEFGYSKEQIKDVVVVTMDRVDEIMRNTAHNGGIVALKSGLEHLQGHKLSHTQTRAVEKYGGWKATYYANQLILLLENKLWDKSDEVFKNSMEKLCGLWTLQGVAGLSLVSPSSVAQGKVKSRSKKAKRTA